MAATTLPKVTIEEYGSGWYWSYEDDGLMHEYRTNREGDGLWEYRCGIGEWKQVLGTMSFSLSSNRRSAAASIRNRVRRNVTKEWC